MTGPLPQTPAATSATNEPIELARYTISAGERVIYGQRVCGLVRLVDVPAAGRGRRYLIERELASLAELEAIVGDYLEQAARWDAIPAAGPSGLAQQVLEARLR